MAHSTIGDAAVDQLRRHRVRTTRQLATHMRRTGISRAADPAASVRARLRDDLRFMALRDDRWILADAIERIPALHRITAEEAATGTLALGTDLGHLRTSLVEHPVTAGGLPLRIVRGPVAVTATGVQTGVALHGPGGWLGHPAGTLVRVTGAGPTISIEPVPEPGPEARMRASRLVETARVLVGETEEDDLPPHLLSIEDVLGVLVADDPEAVGRPMPPFGEVLAGTGIEAHGPFIGLVDTDWSALDGLIEEMRATIFEPDPDAGDEDSDEDGGDDDDPVAVPGFDETILFDLAETVGLSRQETRGLGIVLDLYVVWRVPTPAGPPPADTPALRAKLAALVSSEGIALALGEYAWQDPGLEGFVANLRASARGAAAAGPLFVLGACAEARGAVLEAETHLRAALAADPHFSVPHLVLYRFDIERGNYASALNRLRIADAPPQDGVRQWLEEITRPTWPAVGRNDRCPCGSGRKYKACHLDQPAGGALRPEQALIRKLSLYCELPTLRVALDELVDEAIPAVHSDSGRLSMRAVAAERETMILQDEHFGELADVLLFERGWLARFLETRGMLLPAAERSLAESWVGTRRSLYEVVASTRDVGLTVRDVMVGGDPIDIRDTLLPSTLEPRDLAIFRVRPGADGRPVVSNGVAVAPDQRSAVVRFIRSGDDRAFLRWLVRRAGRA